MANDPMADPHTGADAPPERRQRRSERKRRRIRRVVASIAAVAVAVVFVLLATDTELVEACRAARIHDLIASLPDGYDTLVGERGYRMSGGEKQRLAIARMLLKDPAVVILDEATSHLDSESELAIQHALADALVGRTSLVIAHRLSTIVAADRILVLEHGRIIESGRHEDLLRAGGVYTDLYRTQVDQQAADAG